MLDKRIKKSPYISNDYGKFIEFTKGNLTLTILLTIIFENSTFLLVN